MDFMRRISTKEHKEGESVAKYKKKAKNLTIKVKKI